MDWIVIFIYCFHLLFHNAATIKPFETLGCTHKLDLYINKNTETVHESKGIKVHRLYLSRPSESICEEPEVFGLL